MSHHLVLGTAGHIDHGKSSLVKCLTGSDPDRLPEEKARGVTIELGFAHMTLPVEPDGAEGDNYEIGIVDVPGHADFVNNMVSGVGALDLAIFIVAADDGWMPQSEEHLHILSYLGIKNIIIAMTKADLCEDVPFAVEMLRDELQDTAIAEAAIIPVSSITGDGIDALREAIRKQLRQTKPPQDNGKPRLAIDRIFSPKGTGTVVTGTLSGGSVSLGESLTLQPLGIAAKVRYIQNHNQSVETASPGMRTALNLPDLPIQVPGKPGAQRGHTLTTATAGKTTDTLDILLERMARPIPGCKPRALRHLETVMLHHGSARCQARVVLHGRSHLNPGEQCLAQLRLDEPLLFLTGDRVVLRDGGQQNTLAGGVVLDALPGRQGFRQDDRSDFLTPRSEQPDSCAIFLRTQLRRDHQLDPLEPLPNSPFAKDETERTVQGMISEGSILQHGSALIDAKWWKSQLNEAGKAIKGWHRMRPDVPQMPQDVLDRELKEMLPELFPLLIASLTEKDFQASKSGINHSSHTLTLPEELEKDAAEILVTLERAGLQPPNRSDLTPSAAKEQALKFLIRSGQVVELEPKVVIATEAREMAAKKVREYLTEHTQATASELRTHLDSTRKIVMPLLEHLDAIGLTVRNDNYRSLAE